MKVQILQHVPFEDIGSMASWLAVRDATLSYTRFYQDEELPGLEGLDLIIAMGGPMSVNDEAELPWLKAEKAFLREAMARGIPLLGICLGAQLIASALGARVYPNKEKEIGWFPVRVVSGGADASSEGFRLPHEIRVFHWHGETFDLPPGAVRLASSEACENQAFQIGQRVIGLQFHLETTPESAASILEHCRDELISAPWVQTEVAIRAVDAGTYGAANQLMESLLDFLMLPARRP
jgi:GMP synthase-like glutamine amidotransferase